MQHEPHEPDTLEPLDGLLRQAVEQVRLQQPPQAMIDRSLAGVQRIAPRAYGRARTRRWVLSGLAAMAASLLLAFGVSRLDFYQPIYFYFGDSDSPSQSAIETKFALVDSSDEDDAATRARPLPAPSPTRNPAHVMTITNGERAEFLKLCDAPLAAPSGVTRAQPARPGDPAHPDPVFDPERGEVPHKTEQYQHLPSNPFLRVASSPLSTFSTDVDTASYSLVRRFLREENRLPPPDAVRVEELINYFEYDYPQPKGEHPVSITPEVAVCPWNKDHRLVRIGVQARKITSENMPPRNLVFLIDVSGSMADSNKLPLIKEAFGLLIDQLTVKDRVAIVVYAGDAGVVLPPTPGSEKEIIRDAVGRLRAGGSTNGAGGIVEAYKEAHKNFLKEGVNRVILATDGDFNVGVTSQGDLVRLIEEHRNKGVYLTCLGFGMGNLKDSTIMKLANHGHGHYAYIDSLAEAKKVFVEEGMALVALAQDVKVQVEFNPKTVEAYRLIGYEKRLMRDQDFNDDTKHAAVLGCGHRVTVLYEIVPAGKKADVAPSVDPLRYQEPARPSKAADSNELMAVKIRYKEPMGEKSKLLEVPVADNAGGFDKASEDFRFAAAVAAFGRILRDNPKNAGINLAGVRELAQSARGGDLRGWRGEFIELVKIAEKLSK